MQEKITQTNGKITLFCTMIIIFVTKYKFLQVKNSFAIIVYELLPVSFKIVSAFERWFIIFVACLQHL